MRLLLDTNILIPFADQDLHRLPTPIFGALTDSGAQDALFVSIASIWEIAIKVRLGRLTLAHRVDELPFFLADNRIGLISIEARHVIAEVSPLPDTKDPFDRLLLAICHVERMQLLTTDRKLVDHPLAWRPAG